MNGMMISRPTSRGVGALTEEPLGNSSRTHESLLAFYTVHRGVHRATGMLSSLLASSPALVLPPVVVQPTVQVVQQRAAAFVEPSLPTPFLLAKEGIPKVSYDYTRGLDELNGIDVWADIPTTSEVNLTTKFVSS